MCTSSTCTPSSWTARWWADCRWSLSEDKACTAAVEYLSQTGVAKGTGSENFRPDTPVTATELVTFLGRIVLGDIDPTISVEGVRADDWSSGYMAWAMERDLLAGEASLC